MLAAALVRLRSRGENVPGQPEASARKHTCVVAGPRGWPGRETGMRWSRGREASGWQDPGGSRVKEGDMGGIGCCTVIRLYGNREMQREEKTLKYSYRIGRIKWSLSWHVGSRQSGASGNRAQVPSSETIPGQRSDSALTVAGMQTRHCWNPQPPHRIAENSALKCHFSKR